MASLPILLRVFYDMDTPVTLDHLDAGRTVPYIVRTETGYQDQTHWLMFLYEVRRPVKIERMEIREGLLEWHTFESIAALPIPETDG